MRNFGNSQKNLYVSPLTVFDSTGSVWGAATGGPQGAGTINVAGGFFVNGVAVATTTNYNANNLTGTTLAAGVVNSSLTSLGTLGSLTVSGAANAGSSTITNALSAGSIITAGVSGGNQGAGTINAAAIYLAGVNTVQTGTFTGTITGCTTAPTATFNYTIVNGTLATIYCVAGLVATSNSTGCTITGLPAALTPTNTYYGILEVEDNSTLKSGIAGVSGTTITLSLINTTFTASNSKGFAAQTGFTYSLK